MASNKPENRPHGARDLIEARFRDPELAERLAGVGWNDALDVMFAHRSVRNYLDKPLEPGMLELIVAAAQSAPTTSNLHAWSVIAVENPDTKALIGEVATQKHVAKAPLVLVWVADLSRLREISKREGTEGLGLDYIEAFIFAIADASFAAQNAFNAFESLGLGGCYLGAIRNNAPKIADALGLPDETMVCFGMTVGYPDPAVPTDIKPRLPQSLVLHRERYQAPDMAEVDAYNAKMRDFQTEQQMRVQDWSRQAANRVKDEAALTGRHILSDYLRQRGFKFR